MLYLQTAHLTLCNGLFSYFLLASMPFKRSGCSKGVSHQPTSPPAPVPKKWASSVADFGIRFFNIQPGTSVNIALEFVYDLFGLFKIFLRCLDVGYQSPPIKHQIWVCRVPGPPMGPQFRPILVHPNRDPTLTGIFRGPVPALARSVGNVETGACADWYTSTTVSFHCHGCHCCALVPDIFLGSPTFVAERTASWDKTRIWTELAIQDIGPQVEMKERNNNNTTTRRPNTERTGNYSRQGALIVNWDKQHTHTDTDVCNATELILSTMTKWTASWQATSSKEIGHFKHNHHFVSPSSARFHMNHINLRIWMEHITAGIVVEDFLPPVGPECAARESMHQERWSR